MGDAFELSGMAGDVPAGWFPAAPFASETVPCPAPRREDTPRAIFAALALVDGGVSVPDSFRVLTGAWLLLCLRRAPLDPAALRDAVAVPVAEPAVAVPRSRPSLLCRLSPFGRCRAAGAAGVDDADSVAEAAPVRAAPEAAAPDWVARARGVPVEQLLASAAVRCENSVLETLHGDYIEFEEARRGAAGPAARRLRFRTNAELRHALVDGAADDEVHVAVPLPFFFTKGPAVALETRGGVRIDIELGAFARARLLSAEVHLRGATWRAKPAGPWGDTHEDLAMRELEADYRAMGVSGSLEGRPVQLVTRITAAPPVPLRARAERVYFKGPADEAAGKDAAAWLATAPGPAPASAAPERLALAFGAESGATVLAFRVLRRSDKTAVASFARATLTVPAPRALCARCVLTPEFVPCPRCVPCAPLEYFAGASPAWLGAAEHFDRMAPVPGWFALGLAGLAVGSLELVVEPHAEDLPPGGLAALELVVFVEHPAVLTGYTPRRVEHSIYSQLQIK
jgi:hypothetical protein